MSHFRAQLWRRDSLCGFSEHCAAVHFVFNCFNFCVSGSSAQASSCVSKSRNMSTMRVCAHRSNALSLQLRSRPSAACSEYVGEVRPEDHLWLVHPKWGSAEWDTDGFALVATLAGPPARGYVRMSDISVEWGGWHYFALSDAAWWDRHWFASADRCDVCVYDAPATTVEELPLELSGAVGGLNVPGAVRNGLSESGWTYVALRMAAEAELRSSVLVTSLSAIWLVWMTQTERTCTRN